jgi:CBS domain containing-hemolysin-like protein
MSDPAPSRSPGLWKRLRRALGRRPGEDADVDPMEVIREREEAGETMERDQKDMILKVAAFDRLRVSDVMVPRSEIKAVEVDATLAEVAALFVEHQHSRVPIYRETLDAPVGMVHVKDVLALLAPGEGAIPAAGGDKILPKLKRDILYVPPSMKLPTLLLKMRTTRCHLALVVDEYGGTDGLVSIEDLVEEIVGEIDDEHDDEEASGIVSRGDGVWDADARADIEDFEEQTGCDLSLEDEEDVDTLGGLVFALVGRVPARGEIVKHPSGMEFEVMEADPRRIRRLRARWVRPAADTAG